MGCPLVTQTTRQGLGAAGERLARRHLEHQGYEFIAANWRRPYGELDLIMRDGDTLVFIEVKTRRGERFGSAEESVRPAQVGPAAPGGGILPRRGARFRRPFLAGRSHGGDPGSVGSGFPLDPRHRRLPKWLNWPASCMIALSERANPVCCRCMPCRHRAKLQLDRRFPEGER